MKKIDSATLESVRKVNDYVYNDEEKSYQETESSGHIFEDIERVRTWLDEDSADIVPSVRIENMSSPRGNREVPNQFIIYMDEGTFFQSYASIIAFQPRSGKTVLDESKWDYSTTTGKYRNQFLGEGIDETRKKIKSGEYVLANLNK